MTTADIQSAHNPTPLSQQVSGSRYFFLSQPGRRRTALLPAYGGFEKCHPDYLVQRTGSGFTTVELVVGGQGRVKMNGVSSPLRAGTIFHYGRTTRIEIATNARQPLAKYFICFSGHQVSRRLSAAGLHPGSIGQLAMFPEVQRIIEELIKEGQHHRVATARICGALTEVLLLRIEDLAGLPGQTGRVAEESFLRCKSLIEAQVVSLSTLRDITQAAGIESSQLSRLFHRYQGLSPYQYLLRRKMSLAAERLLEPDTLVKEAAAHVGFADPYHFSRCFKSIHGVSPREFQRSRQRQHVTLGSLRVNSW